MGNKKLEFKKYTREEPDNWYGTASPLLSLVCCFQQRLNEIRLGVSSITVSKDRNKEKKIAVSQFGLTTDHHILLSGVTYAPEKRSAIAMSLGPMTSLISYIKAKDGFETKWRDAAQKSMAHIPGIDMILKVIKDCRTAIVTSIVSNLADLVIATTPRNNNRMFIPLNFLAIAGAIVKEGKDEAGNQVYSARLSTFGRSKLRKINFSGRAGMVLYNEMCSTPFRMMSGLGSSETAELVFHGYFGTHVEDFGVLESITNQKNWGTRNYYSDKMRGAYKSDKEVKLIRLLYYSKMTSACQSRIFTTSSQQIASHPMMSGTRGRQMTDTFMDKLLNQQPAGITSRGQVGINAHLSDLKEYAHAQFKNGKMTTGTTDWFEMKGATYDLDGAVSNISVVETNKFFH